MTESEVPIVVPEGKQAADLTMGELDIASYHLKADVLECFTGAVPGKRYAGFIEVAILWAKRGGSSENADQLRKRFRDYSTDDMFRALRMDEPTAPPDPTDSSDEPSGSSSPPDSAATPTP